MEMTQNILAEYAEKAVQNSLIGPESYAKYDVKRGLRNKDGTGVLVGLTRVGDVHGYIIDERERIPVHGRLRYRGIHIEDLVEGFQADARPGFEETAYLLLFGDLPTARELAEFQAILGGNRRLPAHFAEDMILKAPSSNIMNKLARSVLACYSFDTNPEDLSVSNVLRQCIELIARFPTFTAYAFQAKRHYYHNESLVIHSPREDLNTAENLLHMIRPNSSYSRLEAELLDLCLVLHAEHGGGNNSTFSIHVVSSSGTDTYSAVAAAVGSLKGSKHGGANSAVIDMIAYLKEKIKDWTDEDEVSDQLERILKKQAFDRTGLIYGVGHAVYTLSDPRAVLLKKKAESLAMEKGCEDEFRLYELVERLAPRVLSAVKKNNKSISANVDFYSGFVYSMLNIPLELYTPIFAIARIAGWSAHLLEELISGGRIIRPAYKQITSKKEYVPLSEREPESS